MQYTIDCKKVKQGKNQVASFKGVAIPATDLSPQCQ